MSEAFKLYGAKEAFEVFNRTQLDSADKMRITRSAFVWFNKAIENIKGNHYWKDHTNELTNSHHANILKPFKMQMYNDAKHAKFLAFGTKSHMIRPVKAKALSWNVGGTQFFSKGHKVKGIKANPWLKKSVIKVMPQIKMSVTNTTRLILEGK